MRRVDIKTGFDCNCNCLFCVVGDVLFTGERPGDEVKRDLANARAQCDGVVFTGGEPTMRPDFLELVAYARSLGYSQVQSQSNGRRWAYEPFARACVRAGVTEFSPAIHGSTAKVHDALVRAPGSFDQIVAGITNLRRLGQRIVTNTVVTRQNMQDLPALADLLVGLRVDQMQFASVHPAGHGWRYFDQVVPRFADAAPFIQQALHRAEAAGTSAMAEAIPFCFMAGAERFVSELYIPPTELRIGDRVVEDYRDNRLSLGKTRFPQCTECRFEPICEGPWRQYPEKLGHDEFVPVAGAKVWDGDVVAAGLDGLLGTRVEPLELEAHGGERVRVPGNAGYTLVCFYPEDGSPGCTQEVCSLRDATDALRSAGVTVVGVNPAERARHAAFASAHGLTFPLLVDRDGTLARRLGVGDGAGVARRSFLLDANGVVAHVFARVETRTHGDQVLRLVARIAAAQTPARPAPRRLPIATA